MDNNSNILTTWNYSKSEWNSYVAIEKANKKEDNIFFWNWNSHYGFYWFIFF